MMNLVLLLGNLLTPRPVPAARLMRVAARSAPGIDDLVSDVIRSACAAGDVNAARDLLAVLEGWHGQRPQTGPDTGRQRDARLKRLRRDLESGYILNPTAEATARQTAIASI